MYPIDFISVFRKILPGKLILTRIAGLLISALTLMIIPSCATLFSGSNQKITVQSEPPGAEVYVNGRRTYRQTPCKVVVDRKGDDKQQHYTLKKEGYSHYHHSDHARMNPVTLGNILLGGIIGIGIDWMSGSIYQYEKEVYAILEEKASRPEEKVRMADASGVHHRNHDEPLEEQASQAPADKADPTRADEPDRTQAYYLKSDVDQNIPVTDKKYPYRFALIIGNEDYSSHQMDLASEVDVAFARNDARAFREYAAKTLGLPRRNIIYLEDVTAGRMSQGIHKLNLLAKNSGGKAELYFFYAGHGLPHEQTQEPYLLPVDVSGKNIESGLPLKAVYEKLSEHPCRRVTVFLDACFSGGAREQGLLATRSVKIEPLESNLKGNLIVFAASSGIQSALPYREKQHGFFTYYLLKKFKSSAGDLTYQELADYLKEKVSLESVLVNDKEQHPHVNVSPAIAEQWKSWRFHEKTSMQ